MIFAAALLVALYLLWVLLFSGALFKIILFGAGWVGLYYLIEVYFPDSHSLVPIGSYQVSWAAIIATSIVIMGMATTKVQE